MKLSDEDEKLLFDIDQISARLDILLLNYHQSLIVTYKGENPSAVEDNIKSLKENTMKALAGVDNLNMLLVSLKASVSQLIAQNNRALWGILQRHIAPSDTEQSG